MQPKPYPHPPTHAAVMAEKEKKPWPPKIGPFDHTPKKPPLPSLSMGAGAGADPLGYFDAEEGKLGVEAGDYLRTGTHLTRRTLPPRLPMPMATPGERRAVWVRGLEGLGQGWRGVS